VVCKLLNSMSGPDIIANSLFYQDFYQKTTIRAIRHLSYAWRLRLSSLNMVLRNEARERYYKGIVYDHLIKYANESSNFQAIIKQGKDVQYLGCNPSKGQFGFYYSSNGEISVRRDGQDIATYDFLMFDSNLQAFFGEVILSAPKSLEKLKKTIAWKKALSQYLFDCPAVNYLLVLPRDLYHEYPSIINEVGLENGDSFLVTPSLDDLLSLLKGKDFAKSKFPEYHYEKTVYCSKLN